MEEKEILETSEKDNAVPEVGKPMPSNMTSYARFGSDIYTSKSLMLKTSEESKSDIVVTVNTRKGKYKKYKTKAYIVLNPNDTKHTVDLNTLFGLELDDSISTKNKLTIKGDLQIVHNADSNTDSTVDIVNVNDFTKIGNALIFIGKLYKIYINVATGILYIECLESKSDDTLAVFADFSTERYDAKLESDKCCEVTYYVNIDESTDIAHISNHIKLVNPSVTDGSIDRWLNDPKIKNVYGMAFVNWLLSDEMKSCFDATAFLKKFVPGYMFNLEISDKEFADGQIDVGMVHFDKTAVVQQFYPEIITSVLNTCDIECDDKGTPVITQDDRKLLEFAGIKTGDASNIIDIAYTTIDGSRDMISEYEAKLLDKDFASECFDAECATCAISGSPEQFFKDVNLIDFNKLTEKQNIEKDIEHARESLSDQLEGLASIQMLARYQVKKQMEDGTFRNYHSFSSAMVYFTAMKREEIVKEEGGADNHGALNAFYSYALKKIKFNSEKVDSGWESPFYENRIINAIFGEFDNSYISSLEDFASNSISLARYKDLSKKESITNLIGEVTHKDDFLYSMGNYAFANVMASIEGMTKLANFDASKEEELDENWKKNKLKLEHMMWKPDLDKNSEAVSEFKDKISKLKALIDTNYGVIRDLSIVLLKSIAGKSEIASKSKIKTVYDHLAVAVKFIGLATVSKYLTAISTKQLISLDETGKEVSTEMSDDEVKNTIMNFFMHMTCKVLIVSVYNRLYNSMAAVCESIDVGKDRDISSFFSNVIASMIVCEEALSQFQDSPENQNSELMQIFSMDKRKLIGTDALSIYMAGLTGMVMDDNGEPSTTKTRLNLARDMIFENSLELSTISVDLASNALSKIIERLPR